MIAIMRVMVTASHPTSSLLMLGAGVCQHNDARLKSEHARHVASSRALRVGSELSHMGLKFDSSSTRPVPTFSKHEKVGYGPESEQCCP